MAFVSQDTKKAVEKRVDEVLLLASYAYPAEMVSFKRPTVDYNLRGNTAGTAKYGYHHISLNSDLLNENKDLFIKQTVGHELAHLIAYHVYPLVSTPHGKEWKRVMRAIGLPAIRCHTYNTDKAAVKHKVKYQYACACRRDIVLSSVRHNRIVRQGVVYTCPRCNHRITLVNRLGQVGYKTAKDKIANNAAEGT